MRPPLARIPPSLSLSLLPAPSLSQDVILSYLASSDPSFPVFLPSLLRLLLRSLRFRTDLGYIVSPPVRDIFKISFFKKKSSRKFSSTFREIEGLKVASLDGLIVVGY